ncbi:globoside alpha-1,3-N-acetylgalactosaminyltransferase 1-like isoform X2 [Esox lucius]|uniref:Globoside alpha-1,3-N-acetylgalactosaminyltransferase 1-like n=1 Tax=Esox lucius TaxID=8010 RepID=A0AAY5L897_ESOLU|nr:globoside alpha-1,3-N-acetylgalactosaminyltransferase 1-like isoform X2 [Esox lucius]
MALFPLCKLLSGSVRVTKKQLVLYCLLISLLLYLLRGRRTAVRVDTPPLHLFLATGSEVRDALEGSVEQQQHLPLETSWGAPLVWGDSESSARRRAAFIHRRVRTGLMTLAVGPYAHFLHRFLSSAELYFLPGNTVIYYILTDSPRALDPPPALGPGRELRVVPVAEAHGWDRLSHRRMALLAAAIKEHARPEVAYIYCMDVDQELVATVGHEILGKLVATLHPELYGKPRNAFPYEREASSLAGVMEDEGDYYYTSELYGGLCAEVHAMALACAQLILQDQEKGVRARGLEESYLNRYLINHRPTCVLSPEYSWWDSALSANVPTQRVVSLGRRCDALEPQKRQGQGC